MVDAKKAKPAVLQFACFSRFFDFDVIQRVPHETLNMIELQIAAFVPGSFRAHDQARSIWQIEAARTRVSSKSSSINTTEDFEYAF